jgi:hypothetical protein
MVTVIDRNSMIDTSERFKPPEVDPVFDIETIRDGLERLFSKSYDPYDGEHHIGHFSQKLINDYTQIKILIDHFIGKANSDLFDSSLSWLQKYKNFSDSCQILFDINSCLSDIQELILSEINRLSEESDNIIPLTIPEIEEQERILESASQLIRINGTLISLKKALILLLDKFYVFYSLSYGFYCILEKYPSGLSDSDKLNSISEGLFHIFDIVDRFYNLLETDLADGISKNANIILQNTNTLDLNQFNLNDRKLLVNIRAYCLGILQSCSLRVQDDALESLFPDKESHDYVKRQDDLYNKFLPRLSDQYEGKYVLFEDGEVIDSDLDEDILLDRIWESNFVKERKSIFVKKVPQKTSINA